jgi:ATP-dependent Lon protease
VGQAVEGRDEDGIKKALCAFLKILHPAAPPTDAEFEEYVAYAIEGRRRVKEQMNKRKTDGEFAHINLSFFRVNGAEEVVFCPESKNAMATQQPARRRIGGIETGISSVALAPASLTIDAAIPVPPAATGAFEIGVNDLDLRKCLETKVDIFKA